MSHLDSWTEGPCLRVGTRVGHGESTTSSVVKWLGASDVDLFCFTHQLQLLFKCSASLHHRVLAYLPSRMLQIETKS
eukprot:jgi/Phyca11/560887/estExt2_Genewise1.C_PHYCAscaffold_50883